MTTSTLLNDVNIEAVGGLIEAVRSNPEAGATTWRASVTWNGGFRTEARIRDFAPIPSDEPTALGGTDTAPNPVEQILGALGNCLAVGYAANASARGIELRDLRVDVIGELDLQSFLGLREGHAGFDDIRVVVHVDADADREQLEALHSHVLRTSPVGHTLGAAIPVRIDIAGR
jgi:uncharacterized OsmC-like protein